MPAVEENYEEDLISRIRDLIDGYDKDSILKEYLQNADDSGATELIITFDKQNYPKLNGTEFESANNNALLLSNNSQFKTRDFTSIIKISAQGKTNDAHSTGRFGQGFSSSFSISDHPSFVSNKRAYWFDVLKSAVSKNKNKSILHWDYLNDYQEIEKWLKTFNVAGFDENFKGTIFRLPLRDKITSKQSKINNEIFTFDDFLKWVDKWKKNSDNLLFLRHIHKLILQEVNEDGDKIVHLEIKTENSDEIENINHKIQNSLNNPDNPLDICKKWESNLKELPFFKYKHKFQIKYFDRKLKENTNKNKTFAVTNGLFRGEENCLIKQARKVLEITPNPRKVLPWAGVAIEIDGDKPIKNKGKFFTFLPLPIKHEYPVYIHAWFDLNPKRTEITNNGSGDDKETLIEWNKLLLKYGVSKAWALLIDYLKIDRKPHYSFWAKETEFALNESIIEGFYQNISKLNCLFTVNKNNKVWLSPKKKELSFIKKDNKKLSNAFKETFILIEPKPSKDIIDNFLNIEIELIELSSQYIRDYLKIEASKIDKFPVVFTDITIAIIKKKKFLLEIIKYCANDGVDYALLEDLPLELTLQNDIYQIGIKTLFDKNPDLFLFQDRKYLFLDTDIVNSIENDDTLPSSWLKPTLKNKISILLVYLEKLELSKEWIKEVIHLIIDSKQEEFAEAENEIKKMQIVYQRDEEYKNLQSNIEEFSPFMPRGEDIANNLNYLDAIDMNLVHQEYVEIYKPLLKYNGLITEITPKTLIEHILLLDNYEFMKDKNTREYLLDILIENISWFDGLNPEEKRVLNSIPFIETVAKNIYKKDTDIKLFLPTGFNPPEYIQNLKGEYELVFCKENSNIFELYKKMGIKEQTIDNYIQEIIIPFLECSDDIPSNKKVLRWLSLDWDNIIDKINKDTNNKLKNSSIIPIALNPKKLFKVSNLYLPSIKLPKVLNDKSFMPISFSDKETQNKWIQLLEDLGASQDILPQHIMRKIEEIIEYNNQNIAIDLLNYISNKFEVFDEMKYEDKNILEVLQRYQWYPVKKLNDILKPSNPYSKLKKANELILYNDFEIAGGYYYVLHQEVSLSKKDEFGEYTEQEMAKKLGVVVNIPDEFFLKSFRELMKLNPKNGKVLNYAKKTYEYIGRKFKGEHISFEEEEKTILINNQWVASKYVYQIGINLTGFYSWESLIKKNIESSLSKGLISLGIKEKLSFDFLIELIRDLPQEEKLKDNQLKDAKFLLKEIQEDENNDFDIDIDIPLLTQNNNLVNISHIYISDLPAYDNALDKNEDLIFCQKQFNLLAKKLKILPTSGCKSHIYRHIECDISHEIINILKGKSFKESILRLLYHESKIEDNKNNESILDDIIPLDIIFVKELLIEYTIENNFLYKSDEATYEEYSTLYILNQDDEDDMIEIISKYICEKEDLSRDASGWIVRILKNKMNKSEIKELLDSKKVKELPQNFDTEDEASLYDENNNIKTLSPIDTGREFSIQHKESSNNSVSNIDYDTKKMNKKDTTNTSEKQELSNENSHLPTSSLKFRTTNTKPINELHSNSPTSLSSKKMISPNDFKPVYVGRDKIRSEEVTNNRRENPKEIGDNGENYILDNEETLLLSKTNYFEKAPPNNKGFDIYEKKENGEIIRYIEVKTLTGKWGESGIGITKHQLEFAQQEKNKWWLFVVENINADNTKIYTFKNPVIEANSFRFDSSWKKLVYQV